MADQYSRTRLLLGRDGMDKLKNAIEQLQKPMEGEQISFGEVSTDEG